jgi:hypothetical protein
VHGYAEESADFWHVDTPTIQPMQSSLARHSLTAGKTSHELADDGSDRDLRCRSAEGVAAAALLGIIACEFTMKIEQTVPVFHGPLA